MKSKTHQSDATIFNPNKNNFRGIQDIDLIEEIKKIIEIENSEENSKTQKLVKIQEK